MQTMGSHLGLLFAVPRVGKGSPRGAWPMGWCQAIPDLPNCSSVSPLEGLPLQNHTGVPSKAPVLIFLPTTHFFWVLCGCREGGGVYPGVGWLGNDVVILWIFLAPRSEKWGISSILRQQNQSISMAIPLPSFNSGIVSISWVWVWEPAMCMLLGSHVTVCTLLMPNLSGSWIY